MSKKRTPKAQSKRFLTLLLQVSGWAPTGLTESRIAEIMDANRRSVNNWLRELQAEGTLEKRGRRWFAVQEE